MEIGFIYPDLDMDLFVDTIDSFNGDISSDNLKSFLPRTIVSLLLNVLIYALWLYVLRKAFLWVTFYVTARKTEIIGLFLFLLLLFIIFSLQAIAFLRKKLRPRLLKLFKSEEVQESYSFSAYVERSDEDKLARKEVGFYKMCDTLKKSKITDASAVCDGSMCKVEVAYENPADSSVFTFYLPYHDGEVDKIIVDFIRKCVVFPKEEKENGKETEN